MVSSVGHPPSASLNQCTRAYPLFNIRTSDRRVWVRDDHGGGRAPVKPIGARVKIETWLEPKLTGIQRDTSNGAQVVCAWASSIARSERVWTLCSRFSRSSVSPTLLLNLRWSHVESVLFNALECIEIHL